MNGNERRKKYYSQATWQSLGCSIADELFGPFLLHDLLLVDDNGLGIKGRLLFFRPLLQHCCKKLARSPLSSTLLT
jgi:hypothetical protein